MVSGHDLKRLMKFAEHDEWHECLTAVMDEHFDPILEAGNFEFEDLVELVGAHWHGILWGCAFEDFLTQKFDVSGENIVDEYLKRRGWREKPPAKTYMKALRHSILSLYEISDVVPGKSMRLRDMLRGGESVMVIEHSATQSLKQWDRIAARVVEVGGKAIMSGGVLPFSFKACDILFDELKGALDQENSAMLKKIADEELQHLAPVFIWSWLSDVLGSTAFKENPSLSNSDAEEIEFHDIRFPFASGATQKQIAVCLNQLPELRQENAKFWNWLEKDASPEKSTIKNEKGLSLETTLDDGSRVLGNIELKGKALLLSVNSAERAKRGKGLIEHMLGKLVSTPLTEIRTVSQMLADTSDSQRQELEDSIPPEIARQIMQETLDRHYHETLDHPLPALDNQTPRQAANSDSGRERVIEWLKCLENSSGKQSGSDDPMANYDFSWMWKELGIRRP